MNTKTKVTAKSFFLVGAGCTPYHISTLTALDNISMHPCSRSTALNPVVLGRGIRSILFYPNLWLGDTCANMDHGLLHQISHSRCWTPRSCQEGKSSTPCNLA